MLKKMCTSIITILDFITKYFKTFVFLSIIILIVISSSEPKQTPNLAKIYIKGMILDSANLRAQIEEIKKYPSIKGALLIIDSPGGVVGSSVEMADLIYDLTKSMPVVAHTESVMASGAYYAGVYASAIYANRGSLVGSIGVILNGFNAQNLMQRLGIQSQTLSAGEFKEAGTYARQWSDKERAYLKQIIDEEYAMFVEDVAKARKIKLSDANIFAQGKIFNAQKAKKIGLIDEIGSRSDAIAALQELSNVAQIRWLEKSKFETYMESLMQSSMSRALGLLGFELR